MVDKLAVVFSEVTEPANIRNDAWRRSFDNFFDIARVRAAAVLVDKVAKETELRDKELTLFEVQDHSSFI